MTRASPGEKRCPFSGEASNKRRHDAGHSRATKNGGVSLENELARAGNDPTGG